MTQLRKLEIDLMWDSQRPISAGNRTREYTETFLVPQKFHEDDLSPCDKDICTREHLVYIYSDIPFREKELVILVAREVGALYDTNEIIGDNLCSPIEQTKEEEEKTRKAKKGKPIKEPVPEIPVISNKPEPEIIETEFIKGIEEGMIEALDSWGEEPDYVPEDALIHEVPEPLEDLFEAPEPGPVMAPHVIIDEPDKSEALDLVEMEMIRAHPGIPGFIKDHLMEWKTKGRIHDLYLIYFEEDGTIKQETHALVPKGFRASPELILGQQIRRAFNHAN